MAIQIGYKGPWQRAFEAGSALFQVAYNGEQFQLTRFQLEYRPSA